MASCPEDWMKDMWPASYRGVGFYVDDDAKEGGRRTETHEFPDGEDWYVEDLGIKARTFKVTGFVSGGDARAEAEALFAACETKDAGTLVLPVRGTLQAVCTAVHTTFRKDKLGRIAVEMSFAEQGGQTGGVYSAGYGARLAEVAAAAVQSAVSALLGGI